MKIRYTYTLLLCFLSLFGFAQYDSIQEVKAHAEITQDFRITDLLERYSSLKKGKPIDGYRIQLYSGLREDANAIRKKSISNFPETACVLKYETPDYKVQMGNFRTELEAEKLLQYIRVSFPGAFIVNSKIDLPSLSIEKD
jgi:hypothetical protein